MYPSPAQEARYRYHHLRWPRKLTSGYAAPIPLNATRCHSVGRWSNDGGFTRAPPDGVERRASRPTAPAPIPSLTAAPLWPFRLAALAGALARSREDLSWDNWRLIASAVVVSIYAIVTCIRPVPYRDDTKVRIRIIAEQALHLIVVLATGAWASPFALCLIPSGMLAGFAAGGAFSAQLGRRGDRRGHGSACHRCRGHHRTARRGLVDRTARPRCLHQWPDPPCRAGGRAPAAVGARPRQSAGRGQLVAVLAATSCTDPAGLARSRRRARLDRAANAGDGAPRRALRLPRQRNRSRSRADPRAWASPRHPRSSSIGSPRACAPQWIHRERSASTISASAAGYQRRRASGLYAALRARGALVGLIAVEADQPDSFGQQQAEIVHGLTEPFGIAIDNARMFGRIRTLAADEERSRIARDLHDHIGSSLAMIGYEVDRARSIAADGGEVIPVLRRPARPGHRRCHRRARHVVRSPHRGHRHVRHGQPSSATS